MTGPRALLPAGPAAPRFREVAPDGVRCPVQASLLADTARLRARLTARLAVMQRAVRGGVRSVQAASLACWLCAPSTAYPAAAWFRDLAPGGTSGPVYCDSLAGRAWPRAPSSARVIVMQRAVRGGVYSVQAASLACWLCAPSTVYPVAAQFRHLAPGGTHCPAQVDLPSGRAWLRALSTMGPALSRLHHLAPGGRRLTQAGPLAGTARLRPLSSTRAADTPIRRAIVRGGLPAGGG